MSIAAATFARSIARRTVARTLRTEAIAPFRTQAIAPQFGSFRFASTYYTPAHEYITVEGSVGTVGVTDFAQAALGDIVFVDLPEVDDEFEKGDSFGSVESVKAASDVYAPVTGSVTEVNDTLTDEPALVNTNAEDDGWFIKISISDESELESLMDEAAYKEHCEKESN